jgi:protein-tyrosine phosphatase
MRTRQKERDRPGPDAPWHEIRPFLWMGGHDWIDPAGDLRPAIVTDQFDLVISLFTRDGHGPDPGVEHLIFEIPDATLVPIQIDGARRLGAIAVDAVRQQRNTLIRCHSGYNRSGLVVAQALMDLGLNATDAIALIRRRRSPQALNNETFVAYLTSGLDIASLLTSLET